MSVKTRQQIQKFFNSYKDTDVTFNNSVILETGLKSKEIYINVQGYKIPCILYCASMTKAKVVANISEETFEKIRTANNNVSLRLSFTRDDKSDPLKFFISSKVVSHNPYSTKNSKANFINLEYSKNPPDDLIKILANLLEMRASVDKRKELRIQLNKENIMKLGISLAETVIEIQNIPRKCIIRDLSITGAKIIVFGIAKFLIKKDAILKIKFQNERKPIDIISNVVRCEEVKGRKDLSALAIAFNQNKLPITYLKKINSFFS